ncbi:GH92 family glycosyl hydrolase [Alistipes sp.]|uniref:GH92 family glycosyl hydrolase n=1 Tax=Alistipes sp. TaxID=1872444 RepID=UPI003AF14F81
MRKKLLTLFALCLSLHVAAADDSPREVWSIGHADGSAREFALAPDGFRDFLARDFGYEDKFFLVGYSDPATDFPYVLPGPTDTWGGTWPTSGWRTHQVNILFGLDSSPRGTGYALELDLADYAKEFLPLVKISVNGQDLKFQLGAPGRDLKKQRKPRQNEPVVDTLSITGHLEKATPRRLTVPLGEEVLRAGGNSVTITVLEGSWILFDRVALTGPEGAKTIQPDAAFVREVRAADYELETGQPLLVDVERIAGEPVVSVEIDGRETFRQRIERGRYQLETPMPAVKKLRKSRYRVLCDGREIARGTVTRAPQPLQTPAGYVDTRIGTAHSRWMIAPGPWMPFSMVKLSPDNQNDGWQAGYEPAFENIGCFSHIHEWTLGGLGIMAANGELKVRVGDEQRPDEGYRSRIDKRTEQAAIGYYAADLTDYGIQAEITATTRCGLERFTFPADRGTGRILIELHPQTEYGFQLRSVRVKRVGDRRIEGSCRQYSPGVWSHDADQDYTVHFVVEFDQPIRSVGSWCDERIEHGVVGLESGPCKEAGLFVEFDPVVSPVVQVRSAISPVSVENAAENLATELATPFGWDFEAVRQNQVDTWNELFGRLKIQTTDRLEKVRFYNNMYRSLCSRNTWSDVNGEWVSTDGRVQRVADPRSDVMLGCDAFWNTFWNLNQFWNLVTPEWSGRWARSQLALYDANGWLAKGPAGLNYVPVMVGEHEIPQIVSAWQMGIRDFDGQKALEAAVKMQTTPAQKVHKGFAGNRDLEAYLQHKYVPYDKGRFSNTMEYSYDDWTVGQLARTLGDEATYRTFDERGYWWRNVISPEGYCHMRDSKGAWMDGFDPFRSGANQHYVEGNAWQLTFFVPQDVPALVEKIGRERFTDRLLWGFNRDEAWRYNAPNDQYWDHPVVQGNQQSMHFAFLFNFAGQPWQTQRWSRSILDRYYGTGVANAYLGDEDQGQMSAWAVMASLGLFQTDGGCSAEPMYEIASPAFEEVVIDLGGRYGRGRTFTIKAPNASRKNIYVQSVSLNGKPFRSFRFPASELLRGGEMVVEMGPEPNRNWGVE